MAKKTSNADQSTRDKAKAMREADKRAEKRTRNTIIGVVAVVIVAIIAALVWTVMSQSNRAEGSSDNQVPSAYANGEPIVVSDKGVGVRDENLPDFDMYYSYTCHWCTYLETRVGDDLYQGAENGDYNLVLHPVATATMAFQGPATSAALIVAADDPTDFLKFHKALVDYFDEQYTAQDPSVIENHDASVTKVAAIAREVGIPEDLIAKFGTEADTYLKASSDAWKEANPSGRGDTLGTPELVYNNRVVPWGQGEPDQIWHQIQEGINAPDTASE